jgi:hypothetical protein
MLPYVFVVTALLSLLLDAVWLSFILGEAVELVDITGSFAKGTWEHKRV